MRDQDRPLIRGNPLFASMAEENFAELMQAAYFQQFPTGVQLIAEGSRRISCTWSSRAQSSCLRQATAGKP